MRRLLLITSSLLSISAWSQSSPEAAMFAKSIQSEQLKKYVYELAGDEFEGRETGKLGQKKAAQYLQEKFQSFGIPPSINGVSYLQVFPLNEEQVGNVEMQINGVKYTFKKDFYCFSNVSNMDIPFEQLVFAGYGIQDANAKYDDYKNLDVNGKVVVVFEDEPMDLKGVSRITGSLELSDWTSRRGMKAALARKLGAVALIEIVKNIENDVKELDHYLDKPRTQLDGKSSPKRFPSFYISKEVANTLFSSYNPKYTYTSLKNMYRKKKKNYSFTMPAKGEIKVERKSVKITGENVLGYIEGSDLKEELIIITAHYDHLGITEEGTFYGADDDGSGTAALIELAEAFMIAKKAGLGPRRSILIMPVSGEEKGLLGSEYYTLNPIFPLKNTVANLNIDMIGRMDKDNANDTNYVYLIGSDKLSSELHSISEKNNSTYTNIRLDYTYNNEHDPNQFYYRSDHYNFAKNNIPCIFYFTGVHEDYHLPSDTPDKLHYNKMTNITRLVFYTAWDLANRDKRILVDSNKK